MTIGISVLSSLTNNQLLFDFTSKAEDLRFSTNRHGFADCTLTVPLSQADAFRLYDLAGAMFLRISENAMTAWEGRIEDVRVINGGATLKAFGCWRALYDVPYTGLFSASRVDKWLPVLETDISTHNPKMYAIDFQDRIRIGLQKNATYADQDDIGAAYFVLPDSSQTSIRYFSFDYTYDVPTNWAVQAEAYNSWVSAAVNTITTGGGSATSSLAWDLTATPASRVVVRIYNRTGSAATYSGESGDKYLSVTNVRITSSGSTVDPETIAAAMASYISGINSSQLSSSDALIEPTGIDVADEAYEDQYPSSILDRLAFIGDTSGSAFEVGVWEDRLLHFRQRGKYGRSWYVDVASVDVERSSGDVWNSAYAVYQDAGGRALRTSASAASESVAAFGSTRRAAVAVNTTSSTQAEYARNTYLTDNKDSKPRVSLTIDALFDATGARYPVWMARSGDTVTVRNLPPTVSQQIDKITSFRIAETEYDASSNANRLTPEAPPPALEVLVARQGVGL